MRPVVAGDAVFLRDLYVDTRRDEFAGLEWPAADLDKLLHGQFSAQCRHYEAQYPRAEQLLVIVDGARIGRLYVDRSPDAIHVVDLSLLRAHRGAGLGTELLQALQAEAAVRQVKMRLSVRHDNPAGRLYARLGFIERSADGVYRQLEWTPTSFSTG